MQTEIIQSTGAMDGRRILIHTADSFEAAKEWAMQYYSVSFMEDDADYPGCADFITTNGVVCAIQPVGFKL